MLADPYSINKISTILMQNICNVACLPLKEL